MKKIFLIIYIFIALILVGRCEAKTLEFAQISDSHLQLYNDEPEDFPYAQRAAALKAAIKEINKNKNIKFVVFTGDMIDKADRVTYVAFLKLANKLNKPYYVVIGNHDVFRYKNFNKDNFVHATWLHHLPMLFKRENYTFKANSEIVFIALDGANELMPGPSGYYRPETLKWLDKKLTQYKNKKVVIVQHFPVIPPTKKTSHNTVDADKYIQTINNHDNVIAIVTGHFHYNNIIYRKGIYHISAPAFKVKPYMYKTIKIEYNPKYLFSDPAEFAISQKLYANDTDSTLNGNLFGIENKEGNN